MKKLFTLTLILLLAGCAGKIVADPSWPVPINSEYPTAEVWACGKLTNLGHGVCALEKGQPYDEAKIKVAVYHKGTLKVSSTACGFETEMTYDKTGLFDISIPGLAERNCLVVVTVIPKLPGQDKAGIRVYGMRGYVAIKVLEKNKNWVGLSRKLTGSFSSREKIWVGKQSSDVEININGCGAEPFKKVVPAKDGYANFNINEVIKTNNEMKTCILEGYVRSQTFADMRMTIVISLYDNRMTPLPIPSVKFNKDKLEVSADPSVSVIALDEEFQVSSKAKFKFNGDSKILRALTVNGRSAVGIWKKETGWTWAN